MGDIKKNLKIPKVEITRVPNPKLNTDNLGEIPDDLITVRVNGRIRRPNNYLGGVRKKYIIGDYILKVEQYGKPYDQAKREKQIWKKLKKDERQYFPEIIHADARQGYVLQRRVDMKPAINCAKHKQAIVRDLTRKYKLTDVIVFNAVNWALCAKTGNPLIYDFGY